MINNSLLVPLFAAAGPFAAWAIEQVLPFPFIVEEAIKALLVFFTMDAGVHWRRLVTRGVTIGVIFALSESVFYLITILSTGNLGLYFLRLVYTVPLHVVTSILIILLADRKRPWRILGGLLAAGGIHFFYNKLLGV